MKFERIWQVQAKLLSSTLIGTPLTTSRLKIEVRVFAGRTYSQQSQAFRLGQQQHVQVYRFISQGTIEERILVAQVTKHQLASMTLDAENFQKRHFDENEVKGVLSKLEYSRESFADRVLNKKERSSDKFNLTRTSGNEKQARHISQHSENTFKILDEDCKLFEECGIKDTVQWTQVTSHDDDEKEYEIAALNATSTLENTS